MNKKLRVIIAHGLSAIGILAMLYGVASVILMLTGPVNTGWQTLIYGGILYLMGQLTLLLHTLGANVGLLASTLRFVARHMQKELENEVELQPENDIFADAPQPGVRVPSNA